MTAVNGYTAAREYSQGLVDMAFNGPTFYDRQYATSLIGLESAVSNIAGFVYGAGFLAGLDYFADKIKHPSKTRNK